MPLQISILLCYCLLPFCVCWEGVFGCLAIGCGSTADCAWNQLSTSSSASLMSCSLLTASCCSDTCAGGPPFGHTFCTQVFGVGERPGSSLHSELCTAASPFMKLQRESSRQILFHILGSQRTYVCSDTISVLCGRGNILFMEDN